MPWSAVLASTYNSDTACVFALDGTSSRRFEGTYGYSWGIDAPETIPVIASNSLTGLTGDYNAQYTYGRKERRAAVCESNGSGAAAAAVTLANQGLSITAAEPADEQVNCIRFYRTTSDGESYYYTGERNYCQLQYACCYDWEQTDLYITGLAYRFTIEDDPHNTEDCYAWELLYNKYTFEDETNIITSSADNDLTLDDDHTDDELGTLLHTDHSPPPIGSFVLGPTNNGTLFILKNHQAHYCKPQQPEYWPSSYYADVSSMQYPLVCGVFYDTRPYLFDKRNIYYLAGTQYADLPNMTTFRPYPQEARAGAINAAAVAPVLGLGIMHVGLDGIYRFIPGDSNGIDEKISDVVDPIFKGESVGGVPSVGDLSTCWLLWFQNQLYFGYPSGSDTYPKNVLVFDFDTKKIKYYAYPNDMAAVCGDQYYNRFLVTGSGQDLNQIENDGSTADGGTAIDWEVETKEFVLQTRKHYPRWNKYDINASRIISGVAQSYLNGEVIQTHTLSGDRDSRRRLITIANGNRFSIRLSGSGPVEIYAIESE